MVVTRCLIVLIGLIVVLLDFSFIEAATHTKTVVDDVYMWLLVIIHVCFGALAAIKFEGFKQ